MIKRYKKIINWMKFLRLMRDKDIRGDRYLVLPIQLRPHLDEPSNDGSMAEEGCVKNRRLPVGVNRVDLNILQCVQKEIHHLCAVVPCGAHEQRVLRLDKSRLCG